ncbi:MAG TPA: transcription termination factor NusA [Patescibacteria group bacterium]
MPAVQRSEFYLALNQVATERGVSIDIILETVEGAILAAYRKDHPGIEAEEFSVKLNPNTGEAHVYHQGQDVTPPGFGRIAAQTAKQVILQKVREKEKEAILSDFSTKVGTVMNGTVLRFAGPNVIVDLGKAEAVMPPQEQIGNERYHQNQRLSFYIVEIREGTRGQELIVSRSNSGLLEGLFKREVPEIAQGTVVIKEIAREAGSRSKIAVAATQGGIDPVGSCVGQKGVRVQAIIQEFSGMEKIDIIQWQEDTKAFIAAALSPAKDVTIKLDEDTRTAFVGAPKDQLSIAIGKEGQNARLASKLTGWRIEIKEDESLASSEPEEAPKVEEKKKEVEVETKEAPKEEVLEEKNADETKEEESVAEATPEVEEKTEEVLETAEESKEEAPLEQDSKEEKVEEAKE